MKLYKKSFLMFMVFLMVFTLNSSATFAATSVTSENQVTEDTEELEETQVETEELPAFSVVFQDVDEEHPYNLIQIVKGDISEDGELENAEWGSGFTEEGSAEEFCDKVNNITEDDEYSEIIDEYGEYFDMDAVIEPAETDIYDELSPGYYYVFDDDDYYTATLFPLFENEEISLSKNNNDEVKEEPKEFNDSKTVDGINVTVKANAGVFPNDSTLSVEKISDKDEVKEINKAIKNDDNIAKSYNFDIKVLDKSGKEVQPNGDVSVYFKNELVNNKNLTTKVFHIKEAKDKLKAEEIKAKQAKDTVSVVTDSFSYYTVEFVYDDLTYVLPGNTSVKLSEITKSIGLFGEVTDVSVSNDKLFSAEKKLIQGWVVTAHKAFTTKEWMKITIDGVEYTVDVYDDNENIVSVTYNAGNGHFQNGETTNNVVYRYLDITKYSHTSNVTDDGVQHGNYSNNIDTKDVVTIDGADSLHVKITYGGESASYDWACVWEGNKAINDYTMSVSGRLGGTKRTAEYDIEGDTVTFSFHSDSSGVGNGYGYYAVVTPKNEKTILSGTYEEPISNDENYCFVNWDKSIDEISGSGTLNAEYTNAEHYGYHGDVFWEIMEDGTLYINRDGKTKSLKNDTQWPWLEYASQIKKVQFRGNVSTEYSLDGMFAGCENLTSINLMSLDSTEAESTENMFSDCNNINEIIFGEKSILNSNVSTNGWVRTKLPNGDSATGPRLKNVRNYAGSSPGTYEPVELTDEDDIIARVKDDNSEWVYFKSLIDATTGENDIPKGAFNYANTLSENIVIEFLKESDDEYDLSSEFVFSSNADMVIRTTQNETYNPDGFKSVIVKNQETASMITKNNGNLTVENVVFNGKKLNSQVNGSIFHIETNKATTSAFNGCEFRNCYVNGNAGSGNYSSGKSNGGAIYFYNTSGNSSLNLNDCSFTNCRINNASSSYRGLGGAVIFASNGKNTNSMSVENCKFKNCYSNRYGGAVAIGNDSGSVTIKNTEFEKCKSNLGNGGAFYSESPSITIEKCDFTECSTMTNGTVGGAVCANSAGNTTRLLKLSDTRFSKCTSPGKGGALYCASDIDMNDNEGVISFEDCYTTGGNDHEGGAIFANKVLNVKNNKGTVYFKNCHTEGASCQGGAIFHSGNLTFTNIEDGKMYFENCYTTGTGSDGSGGGAICTWSNCNVEIRGTAENPITFKKCSVKSGGGGAIWQNGGTSMILENVIFGEKEDETQACTAVGPAGAVRANGTLTINNNENGTVSFNNCEAQKGGAIWAGSLIIPDNEGEIEFNDCKSTAKDTDANINVGAGAVYAETSVDITNKDNGKTKFENCESVGNGGAIALGRTAKSSSLSNLNIKGTESNKVIFNNCESQEGGGAIWQQSYTSSLSDNDEFCNAVLENVSITNCEAKTVGAVRAAGNIALNNTNITRCEAENIGAVYCGGKQAEFENNVNISQNSISSESVTDVAGIYMSNEDGTLLFDGDSANVVVYDNKTSDNKQSNILTGTSVVPTAEIKTELTGHIGIINPQLEDNWFGRISLLGKCENASQVFTDDTERYAIDYKGLTKKKLIWTPSIESTAVCQIVDADGNILQYKESEDGVPRDAEFSSLIDALASLDDYIYVGTPDKVEMTVQNYVTNHGIQIPNKNITITTKSDVGVCTITRGSFNGSMFVIDDGNLTLENISINGDKENRTASSEGGIVRIDGNGSLTLNDGATLENSASSRGGGAIYLSSDADFTMNNGSIIKDCDAVNGGGIFSIAKDISVSGEFENCKATNGNGGAICINSSTGELTANNAKFKDCEATNFGGGIYTNSAASNITDCEFDNCNAVSSETYTSKSGGAIYAVRNLNVSATEKGKAVFKNCSAGLGGAITIDGYSESVVDISKVIFTNCNAKAGQGGAVNHNSGKNLTISDSTFGGIESDAINTEKACTASTLGGNVYTNAKGTILIQDSEFYGKNTEERVSGTSGGAVRTANSNATINVKNSVFKGLLSGENGGALSLTGANATIDNCTITDNVAGTTGGGIYSDVSTLTVKNGTVIENNTKRNTAFATAGGIHMNRGTIVIGNGSDDSIEIKDNYAKENSTVRSNVFLANTTTAMRIDSKLTKEIGIVNPSGAGKQFGTKTIGSGETEEENALSAGIDKIIPDTSNEYTALTNGNNLVWNTPVGVCKITDADRNLLQYNNNDAVFTNLADAWNAYKTMSGAANIEVFADVCYMDAQVVPTKNITIRTAERGDGDYDFKGDGCATIKRRATTSRLFYVNTNNITFKFDNITLDGGSGDGYSSTEDGGIVLINQTGAKVEIGDNVAFQNSTAPNGGAIYTKQTSAINFKETNFKNCKATSNGGGLYTTTASACSFENIEFDNCDAANGGGVYFNGNNTSTHTVSFNNCEFKNCDTTSGYGAAFCQNTSGGTKSKETNVNNCSFTDCTDTTFSVLIIRALTSNITDCTFTRCKNTKSDAGGAVYVQSTTSTTFLRDSFNDCSAIGSGGAITIMSSTPTNAYIEGCDFTKCHSGSNGGAIYVTATNFYLRDSEAVAEDVENGISAIPAKHNVFKDCDANYGGAVYHDSTGLITVSNVQFGDAENPELNCRATTNGGAIWTKTTNTFTINGETDFYNCAATNGGAIMNTAAATVNITGTEERPIKFIGCSATTNGGAINSAGTMTLTNYEIKNGNAANGSAIYTSKTVTFDTGEISSNTQSNGGAVGISSKNVRLYFKNGVKIKNNLWGENKCNVYINQESTDIVNASSLSDNAEIGIYPTLAKYSDALSVFGLHPTNDYNYLNTIINDRNGLTAASRISDNRIVWFAVRTSTITTEITNAPSDETANKETTYNVATKAADNTYRYQVGNNVVSYENPASFTLRNNESHNISVPCGVQISISTATTSFYSVMIDKDASSNITDVLNESETTVKYNVKDVDDSFVKINNRYSSVTAEFDTSTKTMRIFVPTARIYENEEVVGTKTYYTGLEKIRGQTLPKWYNYSNKGYITKIEIECDFKPMTCYYMFSNFASLNTIEGLENLDTSIATDMQFMFSYDYALLNVDMSHFDTSNVTNMDRMFLYCNKLTSLDLSSFNTSNVTDMDCMFCDCSALETLDIHSFDTSNVTRNYSMIDYCESLKHISLGSDFKFKNTYLPYGSWKNTLTHNVYGAVELHNTYTSEMAAVYERKQGITAEFDDNTKILRIYDDNKDNDWTKKKYTDGSKTYWYGCDDYTGTNPLWSGIRNDVQKVIIESDFAPMTCSYMFYDMTSLESIENIEKLDTSRITNMNSMFYNCTKITELDVSHFNTDNVTGMEQLFRNCYKLSEIDITNWNTSNVTNMNYMFTNCKTIKKLDLSNFDNRNTDDRDDGYYCVNMFNGCLHLNEVIFGENFRFGSYSHYNFSSSSYTYSYNKLTEGEWMRVSTGEIFTETELYRTYNSSKADTYVRLQGLTAELDTETGVMRIYENNPNEKLFLNGDIIDGKIYWGQIEKTETTPKWYDYSGSIKQVNIECQYIPKTCYYLFYGCTNLTSITGTENLDTSNVKDMSGMFQNCTSLTEDGIDLTDISTDNATSMSSMFYGCNSITNLDLSTFNTTKTTSMQAMFYGCKNLKTLDLSSFDMENTSTYNMFTDCLKLNEITLGSEFRFNSSNGKLPIGVWQRTSTGEEYTETELYEQFYSDMADKYKKQAGMIAELDTETGVLRIFASDEYDGINLDGDIIDGKMYWTGIDQIRGRTSPKWYAKRSNIKKVIIENPYKIHTGYTLFGECKYLTQIDGIENINTTNASTLEQMFVGCEALEDLDLSSFNVSNVTNMYGMFSNCYNLKTINMSGWNTGNVENMGSMFSGCVNLENFDVSDFRTGKVTNMENMFNNTNLPESLDLSSWDVSNVENMRYMFYCISISSRLKNLDVSTWDISKLENAYYMFYVNRNLEKIDISNWNFKNCTTASYMFCGCSSLKNIDLSSFNPEYTIDIERMFSGCSGLESINLSGANTSKVTDMGGLFYNCRNLTELDVSGFDTSNTAYMEEMFLGCKGLTEIDVSDFNTSKVKNMCGMFYNCSGVTELNVSNFDTNNVTNFGNEVSAGSGNYYYEGMFGGCSGLTHLDLSNFNTSNASIMRYMFDGCTNLETLDISNFNTTQFQKYYRENFGYYSYMEDMFYNCPKLKTVKLGENFKFVLSDLPVGMWKRVSNGSSYSQNELADIYNSEMADTYVRKQGVVAELDSETGLLRIFDDNADEDWISGEYTEGTKTYWACCEGRSNPWTGRETEIKNVRVECHFTPYSCNKMFYGCTNLKTIENIENFDTSKVQSMSYMFYNCDSLELDYSVIDTSNVIYMSYMFSGCDNIVNLDLSSWNVDKVQSMNSMFNGCKYLSTLNIETWNTKNATMTNMFSGCSDLNTITLGENFKFTANILSGTWKRDSDDTMYTGTELYNQYYDAMADTYRKKFDVHFYSERSIVSYTEIKDVYSDDVFEDLPIATKKDHVHEGWFTASGIKAEIGEPILAPSYFAHWKKNQYLVTFDPNGGDGEAQSVVLEWNNKYISGIIFEKEDYMFDGWNTRKDGTGYSYSKYDSISIEDIRDYISEDKKVTLYAQWTNQKYNVTFDSNGGDKIPGREILVGNTVGELYQPVREDYTFMGWFTSKYNGEQINENTIIYDNVTYYAHWNKNPIVTFDANGGTVNKETMEVKYNRRIGKLPTPKLINYTFVGWFTERNGGTEFTEDEIITENTTVYAHWRIKLNFNPMGGTITKKASRQTDANIKILKTNNLDSDGKIVSNGYGNNKSETKTATISGASKLYVRITYETERGYDWLAVYPSDVTDYDELDDSVSGLLTGSKTTQTFEVDGSSVKIYFSTDESSDDYYGYYAEISDNPDAFDRWNLYTDTPQNYTIESLAVAEKVGYTFDGWYTEPYAGTKVNIGDTIDLTQDSTIYAHWIPNEKVTVTFDSDGGSEVESIQLYKGQKIRPLPTTKKTDYEFLGWYRSNGNKITENTTINSDMTLIAHWKECSSDYFPILLMNNNGTTSGTAVNVVNGTKFNSLPIPTEKKSGYIMRGWYKNNNGTGEKLTTNTLLQHSENEHYINLKTDNLGLDGKSISTYYQANASETKTVTIDGAEQLYVTVTYQTEGVNHDWVAVYGADVEPTESNYNSSISGKLGGTKKQTQTFVVSGDTAKIYFKSDDGDSYYGYYATVSDVAPTTYYAYWTSEIKTASSGNIVYDYGASWTNTDSVDGRLSLNYYTGSERTTRMHLRFEVNESSSTVLPAGSVKIRIPKYIMKDYSGNGTGSWNISDNIPKYPDKRAGFNFSYIEETNAYVLINNTALNGGAGIDATFTYTFYPSNVKGGWEKDGKYLYDYSDVNVPITFSIDSNLDGTPEKSSVENLAMEVHTTGVYYSSYATEEYYFWNDSWGEKPDDADDYVYVTWNPYISFKTSSYGEYSAQSGTVEWDFDIDNDGTIFKRAGSTVYVKYPKTILSEANSDSVIVRLNATAKITFESGYETYERRAMSEGFFNNYYSKYYRSAGNSYDEYKNYKYKQGGQIDITNDNKPLDLRYSSRTETVSSQTEWDGHSDNTLDARYVSLTEGKPENVFYASGSIKKSWDYDEILSDNDYYIKSIRVTLSENDVVKYNEHYSTLLNSDTSQWEDVEILIRKKGEREYTRYKSIPGETAYRGVDISLPSDTVGCEIRHKSSYYKSILDMKTDYVLLPTNRVKELINTDLSLDLSSVIKSKAYYKEWYAEDGSLIGEGLLRESAADYQSWELTDVNTWLETRTSSDDVTNDVIKGVQTVPISISARNANNAGRSIYMTSGTFYELLPMGTEVDDGSIFGYAYDNYSSPLDKNYYSVEYVENWNDSGRTMMIINVNVSDNIKTTGFYFSFDLINSYENIFDRGTSIKNDVAFVNTSKHRIPYNEDYHENTNPSSVLSNPQLYQEIENDNAGYVAFDSVTSTLKEISVFAWGYYQAVNNGNGYDVETDVIPNNTYTYRMTYSQSEGHKSDNIVFYDVIDDGTSQNTSDWKGSFVGINVNAIKEIKSYNSNATCEPVVYYSTKPKSEITYDTSDDTVWTTEKPESGITAVAIDCSKASDGTDFVMKGKSSMNAYITLRAPTNAEYMGKNAVNETVCYARKYIDTPTGSATTQRADTTATLIPLDYEIHYTSNPVSGTESEPRGVAYGDTIYYTVSIKNNNDEFTYRNIEIKDIIPDGLKIEANNIKVYLQNEEAAVSIQDSTRVTMETENNELNFNVLSLLPGETLNIKIPVTVNVRSGMFESSSTLNSINGNDVNMKSETTYHDIKTIPVQFVKKAENTGNTLSGARMQLLNSSNEVMEEWTSGETPHEIILGADEYKLREADAPDDYGIAKDIPFEVTRNAEIICKRTGALSGDTITMFDKHIATNVTVKNLIISDNPDQDKELEYTANVSEVKPNKTYTVQIGNEFQTFTTDENGTGTVSFNLKDGESAVLKNIPSGGKVSVTQTASEYIPSYSAKTASIEDCFGSANANEALSTDEVTLDVDKGNTEFTFTNKEDVFADIETTNVNFRVVDDVTGESVIGAAFKLDEGDENISRWTSSMFPKSIELGVSKSYTLTQLSAAGLYKPTETPITINVSEDGTVTSPVDGVVSELNGVYTITVKNQKQIKLTVVNVDYDTYNPISGVGMTIKDGDETVMSWTSKEIGEIVPMSAGKTYTLSKVSPKNGYVMSNPKNVTITVDNNGNASCSYEDFEKTDDGYVIMLADERPTAKVSFIKRDSKTNAVITGIKFTLTGTSDDGNTVSKTAISNASGEVSFSNIPLGTYELKESESINGYFKSNETYTVEVKDNNGSADSTIKDSSGTVKTTITNDPYVPLKIKKTKENGDGLSGAQLVLKDTDENIIKEWTSTISGETINVPAGKSYILVEEEPPTGYVSFGQVTFNVTANRQISNVVGGTLTENASNGYILSVIDEEDIPKYDIDFKVVNAVTGEYVPYVDVQIENAQEEVVEEWTSGEGNRTVNLEGKRTYTFKPINLSNNYSYDSDIVFNVAKNGTVTGESVSGNATDGYVVTLELNPLTKVTFLKKDAHTKNNLSSAVLKLETPNDVISTWTTTSSGKTVYLDANKSYILSETTTPSGYETAEPIAFSTNENGTIVTANLDALSGNKTDGYTITMTDVPITSVSGTKSWAGDSGEVSDTSPSYYQFSQVRNGVTMYFTNTLNNNSAFILTDSIDESAQWFTESASDDDYYIYTFVNNNKMYIYNPEGNLLGLDETQKDAFNIYSAGDGMVYVKKSNEEKWMQYSGSGTGIRLYTDANNAANSKLIMTQMSSSNNQAAITNITSFDELSESVGDTLVLHLVKNDSDYYFLNNLNTSGCLNYTTTQNLASNWYLESAGNGNYRIYTMINDTKEYLNNPTEVNIGLTESNGTVFEISEAGNGRFYIKISGENKWIQYSNKGGGVRFYSSNTDENAKIYFQKKETQKSLNLPESITVNLLRNGVLYDTEEVTAANNWNYSFNDLPRYDDDGAEYRYSVSEVAVPDYETTYSNGNETASTPTSGYYDITNTYNAEEVGKNIKLKCSVSGTMGDKEKSFVYDVVFTGLKAERDYELSDGTVMTSDKSGNATLKKSLSDGEEITIQNIPVGATYKATMESLDYVCSYSIVSDSQDTIINKNKNENLISGNISTETETVNENDGTVTIQFRGTKDLPVPTGMKTSNIILLLSAIILLFGALQTRRRLKKIGGITNVNRNGNGG